VQYKSILAMIFNEIKCHVNTSLGLVGGMHPPRVRACVRVPRFFRANDFLLQYADASL